MHHTYAELSGLLRSIYRYLPTVDKYLPPLVRLIQPVKDVHQCCFTGTVFTQKGEDLTFIKLKINVITRKNTGGETLSDILEFDLFDLFSH